MYVISVVIRRFTTVVETVAALCLAAVMIIVFASSLGRYLFSSPIPDAFDLSRLFLGLSIAWGYAVLGFRGGHICVDLFAEMLPGKARQGVEILAQGVLLIFTSALVWKLFSRVSDAYASSEATFDLRLPIWPLIGGIWLGLAVAIVTTAAGLIYLIGGRPLDERSLEEKHHE